MRKISAHFILDGKGKCYSKGILTLDEKGTILDIEDTHGNLQESARTEFYNGLIVPGFVNAHCHLELSHMYHTFKEHTGLVPFLKSVVENREDEPDKIIASAKKADLMMSENGIIAVGDIANGPVAFELKVNSGIFYLTFVEALGFSPSSAEKAFEWANSSADRGRELGISVSIVPHSPYSVSMPLFGLIAAEAKMTGFPLSIHSQESIAEDDLYQSCSGELLSHLQDNLAIDTTFFHPTGENALRSTLGLLPSQNNLLLVHNTFTQQTDINYIREIRGLNNTWFVLCPGSNLYLQNRLPDFNLFRRNNLQICLGTDSLASNHHLSILEEMKIIQAADPSITLEEMTAWASYNGANALGIGDWAGSIEVGKHPGINLLTGLDLSGKRLLAKTRVKKLC